LSAASAVVVLNEQTLKTVRDVYGRTGKTAIMNNGIDEAYFNLVRTPQNPRPPKTLRLLFVGRLSKQKNIIALLRALMLTKERVHLDLIGDGEERAAIQSLAALYKLTNVTFHGRLGRAQVMEFYKTSDALVMPSLYEAQPLVLLEAMAARIPIIGTNVIGVADHIKDGGIIVEPTPQGLAHGIHLYFERYTSLAAMVRRGYAIAQKVRWPQTLKQYEALYEEVLEG
jgi:glycosyltransferase involved in cell wall biosynthesis